MRKLLLFALCLLCFTFAKAQDEEEQPDYSPFDDGKFLPDKIQNPLANIVNLPISYQLSFGDDYANVLNLEPSIPILITKKWMMVTETIIPILSMPTVSGYNSGLGNIRFITSLTTVKQTGFSWGIGPAFMLPAVKESLGNNKFSIGPSLVALKQTYGFTYGLAVQNYFSVVGSSTKADVNILYAEIILSKTFSKDWYVYSNPQITADWNADSDNQWTVPLGLGIGKLVNHRYLPLNLKAGFYRYIANPMDADWLIQAQVSFLINTK
ncbi:neuromedin U [Bizionia myxarmorum]|uniref:Neuromedin U n=1 Tax=Bizionia myxarmorum TaxID=291186 RepID=A0A5D0R9B0_9FLAO|nr:neuromedin U [Bizionia myxarmorum]TYB78240.1 neuromedin U [Bizionia myxarmorum]